jgi:hypothetical protein
MRYQDEQQINELEKLFIRLSVLFLLFIAIMTIITVLTVKGCSNTVAPVKFKEEYYETKFNKL